MPLVFTYGTLKQGQRNHFILRYSSYYGPATLAFKARMFDVGFPVLMSSRSILKVEGEVYIVDADTLRRLDSLESNGRMYKRRQKRLPDGRRVWVYIGMNGFWEPRKYGKPVLPDEDGTVRWRAQ